MMNSIQKRVCFESINVTNIIAQIESILDNRDLRISIAEEQVPMKRKKNDKMFDFELKINAHIKAANNKNGSTNFRNNF